MKTTGKLWIGIGLLALLSPLGLILPAFYRCGSAWGEWGGDALKDLVGYVPAGLSRLSALWPAPMPDYAFKFQKDGSLLAGILAYIFSALLGIVVCAGVVFLLGKLFNKKRED
jgi:cobalt/nickel transport protein